MSRTTFPWLESQAAIGADGANAYGSSPQDDSPFNQAELLDRCMGSQPLVDRLLSSFMLRTAADVTTLEQTVARRDGEGAARLAHLLKGAAANISAYRLQNLFGKAEDLSRADRLDEVSTVLLQLRQELERFNAFCDTLGRAFTDTGAATR